MGFVDPKQNNDEEEALPGASGLYLDLDLKRCPDCRRELTPWQERCRDCGTVGVAASAVPATSFPLPDLSHLDAEDASDDDAADEDRVDEDRVDEDRVDGDRVDATDDPPDASGADAT